MIRNHTVCSIFCVLLSTQIILAEGFLTHIGPDNVPVVVVKGSPYEMGRSVGRLMKDQVNQLVKAVIPIVRYEDSNRYSDKSMDAAWAAVLPYVSKQFKEQLRGLADGAGIDYRDVIRTHMIPVLGNYSCSGAVLWSKATTDGDMYVFRNLDFSLEMRMQEFPLVVVCIPDDGLAHVNPTFAGFMGVQTGMNSKGLALTEMGDSPDRDYPFDLEGIPFFAMFSDLLYESENMDSTLKMIKSARRIKKYHYVIGSASDMRGVKIKAHSPSLIIWKDNDPADELGPENVFENIVINPESRHEIALRHIRANYGKYNLASVTELTKSIPIKGGNLFAVVYNATKLTMHFAYAKGQVESYKRDYTSLDLKKCFDYETAQKTFEVVKRVE